MGSAGAVIAALGLIMAALPVAFLWGSLAGLDGKAALALYVLVSAVAGGSYLARTGPKGREKAIALAVLFAIVFAYALYQNLRYAVPPWVDGVHHTLITARIADTGRIPSCYDYISPDACPFFYHYGFHALAGVSSVFTGVPPHRVLLWLGAFLAAFGVVSVYPLAVKLSEDGGLAAVVLIAALSPFPLLYLPWSRYTHLAGMALLPVTAYLFLEALEGRSTFAAGLGAAGLFLTHYRVFVLFVIFAFSVLLLRGPRWGRAVAVFVTAALLVSPWLPRIWQGMLGRRIWGGGEYNAFPVEYVRLYVPLLVASFPGLIWGIWRRNRDVLIPAAWAIGVLALPNVFRTWLFHNAAGVISLYLPIALVGGYGAKWLLPAGISRGRKLVASAVLGMSLLVLHPWAFQTPIYSPLMELFTLVEREAMEWIEAHTPEDAVFLVGVIPWLGRLPRGADGGWWVEYFTGRRVFPPPLTPGAFVYGDYLEDVEKLEGGRPEDIREVALRRACYVYVGSKAPWDAFRLRASGFFDVAGSGAGWQVLEVKGCAGR